MLLSHLLVVACLVFDLLLQARNGGLLSDGQGLESYDFLEVDVMATVRLQSEWISLI